MEDSTVEEKGVGIVCVGRCAQSLSVYLLELGHVFTFVQESEKTGSVGS